MSEVISVTCPITVSEKRFLADMRGKYGEIYIEKKSLDARNKRDIKWVYSLRRGVRKVDRTVQRVSSQPKSVVIVGSGPSGLFCAERLIRHGIKPIIVERGAAVDDRVNDNAQFFTSGKLNTSSNIQFGEGGAGTFSDGKLNTQTHSPLNREVIDTFCHYGAPDEVGYLAKPHIGSDKLIAVVKNMRKFIIENGGEVLFNTTMTDIKIDNGVVESVTLSNGRIIETSELVLAIGHSARDTFSMLYSRGLAMQAKDCAVGLRIEHSQETIGRSQYGNAYKLLPPADYKLTSHVSERAAFTFCMCPGGTVMAAASEDGGVVTNGMSEFSRDKANANSALIAQVRVADYGSDHALSGVDFQRKLEQKAYALGGGKFVAPCQTVGDYLARKTGSGFTVVIPSYSRGVTEADLNELLPPVINTAIRGAIPDMAKRLRGFDTACAVLTGVESRTSSPLRILRGEDRQSVSVSGVYPVGEGAGYAGGITSSAADGLATAQVIASKYF